MGPHFETHMENFELNAERAGFTPCGRELLLSISETSLVSYLSVATQMEKKLENEMETREYMGAV